jgi:hypothetical protein
MAIDLLWYWPKEGGDLVLKILADGNNVCSTIAHQLHNIAVHECPQSAQEPLIFFPNFVYEFRSGLVFRLFDDQIGNDTEVLEFLAPEVPQERKAAVLLEIPTVLAQAGFEDASTLAKLRDVIRSNQQFVQSNLPSPRGSKSR